MNNRYAAVLGGVAVVLGVSWVLFVPGTNDERDDGHRAEKASASRAPEDTPVLRGRVSDGAGRPVDGARVVVGDTTVETDAKGRYAVYDLAAGDYRLDVEHEAYVSPGPKPVRTVDVSVAPAGQRESPVEIDLTVHEPARITGRVVAGGDGVSEAGLSLYYAYADGLDGPLEPFALDAVGRTDARGRFSLDVAPGRLEVIAETEQHGSKRSREVYLGAGETHTGLVIDVAPTGTLVGRVVGAGDRPVAAEVILEGPQSTSRTRTSDDGTFRFDSLPTDTYRLEARARGHRSQRLDGVEVESGEVTERRLKLQEAEGLFGRVVDPDGESVTGAMVRLDGPGEHERWLRTNKQGVFQWRKAPEGRWSARAFSPAHASSGEELGSTGSEIRLELGRGGYVRGRIVDSNGQPVTGAKLGVGTSSVDGPMPYSVRAIGRKRVTKEDGSFRYGPLRPGRYELVARADGYATTASHEVRVSGGQTAGPVTLTLGEGGVVEGTVRASESGEPLAGATVSVFDMTSPFEPRSVQTDQEGHFEMSKVPGGRRSLRVVHDGYLTRVLSGLQVPEGGTLRKSVNLEKKKEDEQFAFRGIGATLRKSEDGAVVRGTIKGGGAQREGLKQGDVISAVDGERVEDWPLPKVIQKIRGRGGEPVELRVNRDGRRFNVKIVREKVVVKNRN